MTTQSEIKYNRLMKKAEELFISLGYKAVSMEEIAEAAGISKMTIYKHFSSKEDLFIEVVLTIANRTYTSLENEMGKVPDALGKINYLMQFNQTASKDYSLAFYKDVMSTPYIMEKLMKEKYRMSRILFEKIIREGIEKGEIRKVDINFITDMLIMIIGRFGEQFISKLESKEEIDKIIEHFYDFLKYGLLGGDGVKK